MKNKSGDQIAAILFLGAVLLAAAFALEGWAWMIMWGNLHSIFKVSGKPWPSYTLGYWDSVAMAVMGTIVYSVIKRPYPNK